QTAARIRDVARAAHHHGARIRWFDFDEVKNGATPSGGEPFLLPLNSVELTKRHALRKLGALRFLALKGRVHHRVWGCRECRVGPERRQLQETTGASLPR